MRAYLKHRSVMTIISPGVDIQKTGRANADLLVGQPLDDHRNYSAARTEKLKPLKFKRRPRLGHNNLYVQGFELDKVGEVLDASQGVNIPKSWLQLAKWENYSQDGDPPSRVLENFGNRQRPRQPKPVKLLRQSLQGVSHQRWYRQRQCRRHLLTTKGASTRSFRIATISKTKKINK